MREAAAVKATTISIDLVKLVLQLHGVDQHGKVVLKKLALLEDLEIYL